MKKLLTMLILCALCAVLCGCACLPGALRIIPAGPQQAIPARTAVPAATAAPTPAPTGGPAEAPAETTAPQAIQFPVAP